MRYRVTPTGSFLSASRITIRCALQSSFLCILNRLPLHNGVFCKSVILYLILSMLINSWYPVSDSNRYYVIRRHVCLSFTLTGHIFIIKFLDATSQSHQYVKRDLEKPFRFVTLLPVWVDFVCFKLIPCRLITMVASCDNYSSCTMVYHFDTDLCIWYLVHKKVSDHRKLTYDGYWVEFIQDSVYPNLYRFKLVAHWRIELQFHD